MFSYFKAKARGSALHDVFPLPDQQTQAASEPDGRQVLSSAPVKSVDGDNGAGGQKK